MNDFSIKQTRFSDDKEDISFVREQVFINEQHVPVELEWDEYDDSALHLLVTDVEGNPLATCRMIADGHIGRMAVLKDYRHQGIGTRMLNTLIDCARQRGLSRVKLSAQVDAIAFYEEMGFVVDSETYLDANIPHRDMFLELT